MLCIGILLPLLLTSCSHSKKKTGSELSPEAVEKLVKEAYFHSFPIVLNYKAMYVYNVDRKSPVYLPLNTVRNFSDLLSPADRSVVSPNNDTYYFCLHRHQYDRNQSRGVCHHSARF